MKEEIKDYETVERTRERTICDECGSILETGDSDYAVQVAVNPEVRREKETEIEPASVHEAHELNREIASRKRRGVRGDRAGDTSIQRRSTITTRPSHAAALLDWCPDCVKKKTGKEISRRELVTDSEFDEGPSVRQMLGPVHTHAAMFALGGLISAVVFLDLWRLVL